MKMATDRETEVRRTAQNDHRTYPLKEPVVFDTPELNVSVGPRHGQQRRVVIEGHAVHSLRDVLDELAPMHLHGAQPPLVSHPYASYLAASVQNRSAYFVVLQSLVLDGAARPVTIDSTKGLMLPSS